MRKHSPAYDLWKRFLSNPASRWSLMVILLVSVISIFCYTFMPDQTPNANNMNLSISLQKPGFSIQMLQVPNTLAVKESSFLRTLILGKDNNFKEVPLSDWELVNDTLFFHHFTGVKGEQGLADKIPISRLGIEYDESEISSAIKEKKYWLGTDRYGRDMLSRMLAGTRVSLSVGMISVCISLLLGITLGSLAGYFRGWIDDSIMFLINVIWSIPTLLLVIAITLALGKGFVQVFIAVGLTMWVDAARIVRGQVLSAREADYVEAGRALGFSHTRLIFKHILPNILGPVAVVAASNFASAILLEAGLSFLGIGAQPPTPSWGMMVKDHYGYLVLDAAYLALLPGFAIFIMVLCFTMVGNGIRDALDTKESMI